MQVPPFSLSKQIEELQPELDEAVLRVLRSGNYIGGQVVQAFEETFAASINVPYAIGCNSGTDALILALRALDIGQGDEVITCSFSFFATAEAISAVGATPVFVDVDPNDYLIDLQKVEDAISPATRAILPVHLFGRPVDMERLMKLAKKKDLKVIEDCAQACGTKWNDQSVGSWGDIGCFSFFPTKNLGAAGDAGATTTKDFHLAKRMRELAIHGMPRRYLHAELGYNSRLDAIQAAILNVKLPRLPAWIEKRQLIAARYQELLKDLQDIDLPVSNNQLNMVHSWNQYVIKVRNHPVDDSGKSQESINIDTEGIGKYGDSRSRDWLKASLYKNDINTIIYYPIPIHLQPAYQGLNYKIGELPIAEKLCSQVLSLPIFPEITFEQQKYVAEKIKQILSSATRLQVLT